MIDRVLLTHYICTASFLDSPSVFQRPVWTQSRGRQPKQLGPARCTPLLSQSVPPTNGRCVVINHNHATNLRSTSHVRSLAATDVYVRYLAIMPRPPNKILTLAFVIDGKRVLLGYKKRGFGKSWWNGFGGKVHQGESVEDGAKR